MMRKFFLFTAGLAAWAASVSAQSLPAFRHRLEEPFTTPVGDGVSVVVNERGDAAVAVEEASREHARLRFKGYRVCVFFDNGQDARVGAEAARQLFATTYPDTPVYIAYNSPYFTVTAGDCVTAEEAIILMGRVKATFPKAFLKNEELTVADLVE